MVYSNYAIGNRLKHDYIIITINNYNYYNYKNWKFEYSTYTLDRVTQIIDSNTKFQCSYFITYINEFFFLCFYLVYFAYYVLPDDMDGSHWWTTSILFFMIFFYMVFVQ